MPPADPQRPSTNAGDVPAPAPLPVQLHLAGRRCVVVGAGPVGARRALTLASAGARVVVVAPRVDPSLESGDAVTLLRRELRDGDLDGADLVVAATGDKELDERVVRVARLGGALVNHAGDAARSDVSFPAVVRRGPVSVAVSTGSRAPAAARVLAELVDSGLDGLIGVGPEGYVALVELVEEVRAELAERRGAATGVTERPADWRSALDGTILGLIDQGRRAEAKERLLACLSSS